MACIGPNSHDRTGGGRRGGLHGRRDAGRDSSAPKRLDRVHTEVLTTIDSLADEIERAHQLLGHPFPHTAELTAARTELDIGVRDRRKVRDLQSMELQSDRLAGASSL